MTILISFLIIFISFPGLSQVNRWGGPIERAENVLGMGFMCNQADQSEYEFVECQVENYSIHNRGQFNDFNHLTEELIFMEATRRTHQLSICQEKLHNTYQSDEAVRNTMKQNAYIQFQDIKEQLRVEITQRAKDRENLEVYTPYNYAEDRFNTRYNQWRNERIERARNALNLTESKIRNLIARVPMGNRPEMQEMLAELVQRPSVSEVEFSRRFEAVMSVLRNQVKTSNEFFQEISRRSSNGRSIYEVNDDLKMNLVRTGQIDNVVHALGMKDRLASGFVCRTRSRYETGPSALRAVEIPLYFAGAYGLGRLAVRAGVGVIRATSAAGRAAAHTTQVMSKMAMIGLDGFELYRAMDDSRQACFPQEFLAGSLDDQCTAESEVNGVYQEASIAQCVTTSVMGIAPIAFVGGVRVWGRMATRAVRAEAQAVEEVEEIIVTAPRRGNQRTEAPSITVSESAFNTVRSRVGAKLDNPAIQTYVRDEFSKIENLTPRQRTQRINQVVRNVNNWDRPSMVVSRNIANIRHSIYERNVAKFETEYRAQHPDAADDVVRVQARTRAQSKMDRIRELRQQCSSVRPTPANTRAGTIFAKYSIGLGFANTGFSFTMATWDQVKDRRWATRLGYELASTVVLSYISSKIQSNPGATYIGKVTSSTKVNFLSNMADALVYQGLFTSKTEAQAEVERMSKTPNFEEDVNELLEYLNNESSAQQFVDGMGDMSNNIMRAITGRDQISSMSAAELARIDQNSLKDPAVQERIMDLVDDKLNSDQRDGRTSGSVGLDRFGFNTGYSLLSTPINTAIGLGTFYAVCMNIDSPIKAMAAFGTIQFTRQNASGYLYYSSRDSILGQ